MDYVAAAVEPITEGKVVRIACSLFAETGKFQEDYLTWQSKLEQKKTFTTFQAHFIKAQANLQERQKISCQGEYHTGTAKNAMEFSMDLANLAQATAEDLATVTNLTTSNSTFAEILALYANRLSTKEADNMAL